MLDLAGCELSPQERALLAHPQCGGVILFTRNFASREQLTQLTGQIRQANPALLIAVDHEGGRVQRFREGFTRLPPMASFEALYNVAPEETLDLLKDTGWLLATELLACGVDFSFTPVLDLDFKRSDVIGDRAFSADPVRVAVLAGALIEGMHEAGMPATGKHFPGHGWVTADSHIAIPTDTRALDSIRRQDLVPFAQLARQGLDAVMPAHVIYEQVDPLPAGFSPYWLQQVLRGELGFEGVIFSDDLSMEGASVAGGFSERAQSALSAGCDMVLVCNNPEGAREVLGYLEQADLTLSPRLSRLKGRIGPLQDRSRQQRTAQRLAELEECAHE
ncbi:beta-N-acetylhexosaminidase [Aestuariirhabdus litorea]|uniref:Beta-hexosaminidase n=1 Tax=Aestuariirhabdus litorea TaxID=2528527 RepID=A0A3P3VPG9_9GAMM|nr:beta-N-acetylhexosaminidase [Aestuariirhabdus litorea]RRJ84662.1 beta-N-acetylhexosaminidase [Aestuariirhabdus litorea]RWW97886.1 beta-N-acetylhexosaminidase [Endozoicomonadaceae bacterium GTF-13]